MFASQDHGRSGDLSHILTLDPIFLFDTRGTFYGILIAVVPDCNICTSFGVRLSNGKPDARASTRYDGSLSLQ